MTKRLKHFSFLFALIMAFESFAQHDYPESISVESPTTWMWAGSYGMIRLSERVYWDAQFHYRTINTEQTRYVGRLVQIYNRHAINVQITDRFRAAWGGVLRLNFAAEKDNPNINYMVP